MFERFTREARAAVERAVGEAERLGAGAVEPEHLLLALERELEAAGVDGDALRRDAAAVGGLDPEALATLGIDLDAVRRQAEETFGAGALERASGRRRTRFSPAAKRALERTLREALELGHRGLRPEHMVLALTYDARATAVLERQGVDGDALRAAMLEVFAAARR